MAVGGRAAIEAFIRRVVAEIDAARAQGALDADAIAAVLNRRGFTTRKGRHWTGTAVEKFLASPGAMRYRGEGGPPPSTGSG